MSESPPCSVEVGSGDGRMATAKQGGRLRQRRSDPHGSTRAERGKGAARHSGRRCGARRTSERMDVEPQRPIDPGSEAPPTRRMGRQRPINATHAR